VGVASYYSVRLWLLRLGLYQLTRPKTHADDWMWRKRGQNYFSLPILPSK